MYEWVQEKKMHEDNQKFHAQSIKDPQQYKKGISILH